MRAPGTSPPVPSKKARWVGPTPVRTLQSRWTLGPTGNRRFVGQQPVAQAPNRLRHPNSFYPRGHTKSVTDMFTVSRTLESAYFFPNYGKTSEGPQASPQWLPYILCTFWFEVSATDDGVLRSSVLHRNALTCSRVVPCSNLGRERGYPLRGFPQTLQESARKIHWLGHDYKAPNYFQFTSHQST
jgi:hypothetical protein